MIKKVFSHLIHIIFNFSIFLIVSTVIVKILWIQLGNEYVYGNKPIGSDYFNALTYQVFFSKAQPSPITGWLPFWNEGSPVIGGYPALTFYLTNIVAKYKDLPTALNLVSFWSLNLFFICTLALFWQVSKNWLFAIALTIIVFLTRATYYQLTTGGFIASATAQWYLPAALFLIFRFFENYKKRYLIAASITSGLSLIHQAPTSLLMTIGPSVAVLVSYLLIMHKRFSILLTFLTLSLLIGTVGLYTVILQVFSGSGTDACTSPQCWGEYPKHLVVWFTPLTPIIAAPIVALAFLIRLFKKYSRPSLIIPSVLGMSFFILYGLLAYFKLIDGLSNVIFPTRIFWAGNLFILLTAATAFSSISRVEKIATRVISLVLLLVVILVALNKPVEIHKDLNATVPVDIASYTIPKYQTKPLSDLIPDWLITGNNNSRIDILNPGITHWWNSASEIPSVRGYSNHPLGIHKTWQYYLQTATRNVPENLDDQLAKNRILFLLNAFGIRYIENSQLSYPKNFLEDDKLIKNFSQNRDLLWYELAPSAKSEIIEPVNSQPVLVIGSDKAYETLIRVFSLVNLNSQNIIPIKGPASISKLTDEELKKFPVMILYGFNTKGLNKLTSYVSNGGKVFIDLGSSNISNLDGLPEIFPASSFEKSTIQGQADLEEAGSYFEEKINVSDFDQFYFEDGPWQVLLVKDGQLKSWATPILLYENKPILIEGQTMSGKIIVSGLNLPFHAVQNDNLQEAELIRKIILKLTSTDLKGEPKYTLSRATPDNISVRGENFSGIYFKENFHNGWTASINGKSVKIYKAGLDFMYVPTQAEGEVKIRFGGGYLVYILLFLSLTSLFISVVLLIYPNFYRLLLKPPLFIFKTVVKFKITRRLINKISEE